ncbi:MAG: hypothetical protein HKN26_12720 [Acidimicrobiales bacterium]|nr:hypothetical protein [Acidimicrobiales bacterium]
MLRPRRTTNNPRASAMAIIFALLATLVTFVPITAAGAATHADSLVPQQTRTDTPKVLDGTVTDAEQVGNRIVVVGTFTQIEQGGVTYDQPYVAAYFLDSGQLDTDFRPVVDREVAVAVSAPNGDAVYIGGKFTNVDGATRRKVAKLNADGSLDTTFSANAFSAVQSLAIGNGKLYVGGNFKVIKGQSRLHLAAVDATTGQVDSGFNLPLTGPIGRGGQVNVFSLDLTSDNNTLLAVHTALDVDGQRRVGAALIDVSGPTATLLPWRTRLYEDELPNTGGQVQVTDGALSPDDSFFVLVATGGDNPPTNDSAVKFFRSGGDNQQPDWVSRHFDSMYAVDISESAVYVGGHFQYQEAPGSTDPFPGDPDINYGAGQGLGPTVLGDEVVAREQLGALNIATGKSLNWDPGASGFHGVEAVTVIERGLLVGHDGSRIGGNEVGRHGILDFQNVGGADELDTFIDEPRAGRVYTETSPILFAGRATAPDGIDRVQIEVQDVDTKQWLRRDGTLGAYQNIVVNLTNNLGTTSDWNYTASLPGGDYRVRARAFDVDGDRDPVKASVRFTVQSAGDITPPDTVLENPPAGTVFTSNDVTFSGSASDDVGVAAVKIAFYDRDNLGYLRPDGSIGAYADYPTVLDSPGATGTGWSYSTTLPSGRWRVVVKAIDVNGNADPSDARRSYVIQPGNNPPAIAITSPANEISITDRSFTLTGTATDDFGVQKVRVMVRNEVDRTGPLPGGFIGPARFFDVPVSVQGDTSVTWTYTTPDLPAGRYRILARAVDTNLVENVWQEQASQYINLVVPGDAQPDTVLTSNPRTDQDIEQLRLDLAGTATDDNGVAAVKVVIYDWVAKRYLHADGVYRNSLVLLDTTVDNPGATSVNWSFGVDVAASRYEVYVYAQDSVGQYDPSVSGARCTCFVYPGDADPTTQMNTPTEGAVLPAGPIAVGGRIFDDNSVSRVQIFIRNRDTGQGPRQDGTIGNPQWVDGFLTNPGGSGSDFQYTSIALPAGRYTVQARAIDGRGHVDLVRARANIELE